MDEQNYVIVVGVDGSPGARQALHWAVQEAHTRGGSVQAVTAWHWDFPALRDDATDAREIHRAQELLEREVESLPAFQRSGVPISAELVVGKPADVLVASARQASLLVLGSHGHRRQLHQVLGSVTEECIRNASCPVVVLPVNAGTSGKTTSTVALTGS